MLRSALRSIGGALDGYDLLALTSVGSLCLGLGMIHVALAFIAFGAIGLLFVVRNAPAVPTSRPFPISQPEPTEPHIVGMVPNG